MNKKTMALLMGSMVWPCSAQSIYRDPQQRFTVPVPAGWTASGNESGVSVVRGRVYASVVLTDDRGAPGELVSRLADQAGKQWKSFQELKRGELSFAGQPGAFAFFGGTNPAGVRAFLKVVAAPAAGKAFAMLISAPETEFAAARGDLDRIEAGFALSSAAPAAGGEKLAALEAAYKAGILTREEYEAKKRGVAGGSSGAAPPASPGGRSGAEFRASDGSFATLVPAGWKGSAVPGGAQPIHVFQPDAGGEERILVMSGPAPAASIQELTQQAVALVTQMFPFLRPTGAPSFTQTAGAPAAEISYRGTSMNGQQVSSWHGIILKERFYFAVFSMAPPEKAAAVEQSARTLHQNMRPARVPENTQLARAIVGRWTYFQGGSTGGGSSRTSNYVSRQVTYYPDGRFHYVGGVMVTTPTVGGAGGGASGDSQYTGTYRVYGNTLYAQIDQGGQGVYTLELVQGGGLKINGDLYIREQ